MISLTASCFCTVSIFSFVYKWIVCACTLIIHSSTHNIYKNCEQARGTAHRPPHPAKHRSGRVNKSVRVTATSRIQRWSLLMTTQLPIAQARTKVMQTPSVDYHFLRLKQQFQSLVTSSYLWSIWTQCLPSQPSKSIGMDGQGSSAGSYEKIHTQWLAFPGAKGGTAAVLEEERGVERDGWLCPLGGTSCSTT